MTDATRNLLEQHFDTAFAAPDGIKKLRELILTLAMQGKLAPQDPNDPPASELLKQIEAEKQRLHASSSSPRKRGSRSFTPLDPRSPSTRGQAFGDDGIKTKSVPSIKPEEVPYELPQGWEWVRLRIIAEINGGFAFKSSQYSNEGIRVVRISDFDEKGFKDDKIVRYPYSADLISFNLESNNILMAMTGGTVGKSLLVKSLPEPMVTNQRVATIKIAAGIIPEFVNGLIRTNLIQSIIHAAKNSTNDNISMGDITGFFVPLPPLPEQHRIVAKIDQLMTKCDELEALRKAREEKRRTVHAAAIRQLLDTTSSFPQACSRADGERESSSSKESNLRSPSTREQAYGGDGVSTHGWNFIQQHFGELYTVKENVAELRKTILQLAVMGRLVPQDPNDPPASELLKEIEAEKQRLVKAGTIKQPKLLPTIKPEEAPYQLPQGWEWVYLQDVFGIVTDGDHQAPPKSDYGIPFLVIGNLNSGQVNFDGCRYVPQDYYEALDWGRKPTRNDILYTVTGSYGISIQVEGKEQFCVQRHVAILKSLENTPVQFIRYLLRSAYALNYATTIATGIAQKTVPLMGLRRMFIALPPAIEQHRIVAKIDQLMALCDRLEQQIDAATGKQAELLNAVMAAV